MGDHRASIKAEFSMYGETKKCDMWINWSPDSSDYQGIDQRVLDFFHNAAHEMQARYYEEQAAYAACYRELQLEERERSEYARLKAKFEKEKANEATDTTQEDQSGGQLVQRGDRRSDA